jgi:hypothetical protein
MNSLEQVYDSRELWNPEKYVCYGLVAADEPTLIRYVGRTVTPVVIRFASHIREAKGTGKTGKAKGTGNSKKSKWIAEVHARGSWIELRVLSEHDTKRDCIQAEKEWWELWNPVCELFNGGRPC